jgi:hypothetical protein
MHFLHLIAVEATSGEEAIAEAEGFLDHYGNGDVWDWYAIGGRWAGCLMPDAQRVTPDDDEPANPDHDGEALGNTLCYSDDPDAFRTAVAQMVAVRDEKFRELTGYVTGRAMTADEAPDGFFGFPITDPADYAARESESRAASKEAFDVLLSCQTLDEWDRRCTDHLLAHRLWKLGHLAADYYSGDHAFWDAVDHSGLTTGLWARCEEKPEAQWLVAVDLHN